jgi:hypothetical protein
MSSTLESLRQQPNLASKINDILKEKFIYTEAIADILAAAIYGNQNVILYGPGGHGKSEMVEEVLEKLGLWSREDQTKSETLVQSFGEGLDEAALWGGIDFKKLNSTTDPDMVFNVENSFLNYPVAVFEELFDAPAFCLLPLKHTLQAGFLAKNGRSYKMKTELIIACTNRNPDEIAEMGETYRALLERFVLRQEVAWAEYKQDNYVELISKHPHLKIAPQDLRVLAGIMEECQDSGHTISPRTAMKAVDVLIGHARSHGNQVVTIHDFVALRHVTGFQQMAIKFQESLASKSAEEAAAVHMQAAQSIMHQLIAKFDSITGKVLDYCVVSKQFALLIDKFQNISVPDRLYAQRNSLIDNCNNYRNAAVERALSNTRAELPQ